MRSGLLALVALVGLSAAPPAAAQDPDSLLVSIARLEAAGRWPEAVPLLEQYLAHRPDDAPRLAQLGQYLAWQGDRDRGARLLRRAIALDSAPAEPHAALGEILSWTPRHREEAGRQFEAALARDPGNLKARVGQANLLAWSGRAGEALARYRDLRSEAPDRLEVLRGLGGALNQLQRFEEGLEVLGQARRLAPDDPGTSQELAQAYTGLGEFRSAQRSLAGLGRATPELRLLQDTLRRAVGSWVGVETAVRDRSRQLDGFQLAGAASAGLRWLQGGRVTARYERARFRDQEGGGTEITVHSAGAGLVLSTGRRLGLRASVTPRWLSPTGTGREVGWDGELEIGWSPSRELLVQLGGERRLVEETRDAVLGGSRQNLARLRVEAQPWARRLYLAAAGGLGAVDDPASPANDRWETTLEAGWVVSGYRPFLRIGYAFSGLGFETPDHPAYFSPYRAYLNVATVTASHRFGERVFWEADGRIGRQVVQPVVGAGRDGRVAGAVHTRLGIRLSPSLDLGLRYFYLDVFDAFRLHQGGLVLRQVF